MKLSNELKNTIKVEFEWMKGKQSQSEEDREAYRQKKDSERNKAKREAKKIIEVHKRRAELEYSLLKTYKKKIYTEEEYLKHVEHLSSPEYAKKVRDSLLSKGDLKNADPTSEGKEKFFFNWWVYNIYELIKKENPLNKNTDIYKWISEFLEEKKYDIFYTPETLKHVVYKYKKKAESAPYFKACFNHFYRVDKKENT